MAIRFSCPNGHLLTVASEHEGKTIRCPKCGATMVVPSNASLTSATPPPPPVVPPADEEEPAPRPVRSRSASDRDMDDDDFERPSYRQPKYASRSPSAFVDFLVFRRMVVPILVQVIFWIGVVLCVIAGFLTMFGGMRGGAGGLGILMGLLTLVLGPVVVRVYCEVLIVIFRINETLTEIKNELQSRER